MGLHSSMGLEPGDVTREVWDKQRLTRRGGGAVVAQRNSRC